MKGTVYTETVVHSAPEAYVKDAPYQIAIVDLDDGRRITARITGGRAAIGDRIEWIEDRAGVPYFKHHPGVDTNPV